MKNKLCASSFGLSTLGFSIIAVLITLWPGLDAARGQTAGPSVNLSKRTLNQTEPCIALNPVNPNNLVAFANVDAANSLLKSVSWDGGVTWTNNIIATGSDITAACCDSSAAFDSFGNLFLVYINSSVSQIVVALSTDGGSTLSVIKTFAGSIDQPTITTGPGGAAAAGSVWVTFNLGGSIVASGAPVTGLGAVGAWTATQTAPGGSGNFGDIAVGPNGEVMVTYQISTSASGGTTIYVNFDPDGLGPSGFSARVAATTSNVGVTDAIPANSPTDPGHNIDAEAGLAWDRSGGPHNGRIYLLYTDETPDESNNTEILVRFSDNNGTTWSAPILANDDGTARSQFLPRIALDQTTGNIAACWYDARNDAANTHVQFYGAVSVNGGLSFLPNVQISPGISLSSAAASSISFGDYTGLVFHNGRFYPIWADNSNSTGDNPAGVNSTFDIYSARVTYGALPNDNCAGALPLAIGATFTMDTSTATSTGDPVPGCSFNLSFGKGVWFTYSPLGNGNVTISTCGSTFDTVLGVYTGSCGSLTEIACDDDNGPDCAGNQASVTFAGTAGVTYYILAGGYASQSGTLNIKVDLNDTCAAPIALLPGLPVTIDTSTATSAGDPIPTCSSGGLFGKGIWFTFTPAATEPVLLSACGSSFDTVLGVYTGSCGSLTQVACDDDNGPACNGLQSSVIFPGTGGTTYYILAGGYNSNSGTLHLVAELAGNNQCAGAIALTAGTPYSMSTLDASSEGDAAANCGALGNGVWFTFNPSISGVVTLDTCGSGFDTAVQVYTGSCGSLVAVGGGGCSDDSTICAGNYYASYAEFMGAAGTTYYVQAGGYSGDRGNLSILANVVGPVTLTVNSSPDPVLIGAVPVDTSGLFGGTSSFTRTYGSGTVVSLSAPAVNGFNVFSKWQLDGADLTTSQSATVTMNANHTAAAIYAPANDLCAGAIPLTNGVTLAMNTTGATSAGDPLVPCASLVEGVWFTFTPTNDELVTVTTCPSSFDTVIEVYTGTCGTLQRVLYGCDDDNGPSCGGTRSSVVFGGLAGTNYYFLVGGFSTHGTLQITATSALVNDDCTGALPLHYGVPLTMTTVNATTGPTEAPSCQPNFGKGVWFTFFSPITGPVPITTCGSSFDSVVEVYTGSCGILASVSCNDDFGPSCPSSRNASLSLDATAGTQYFILAGGYNSASGELSILVGTEPNLAAGISGNSINLAWPSYYSPWYVLQQQAAGPSGIGSGTWQDMLPNTYGGAIVGPVIGQQPTFFRLKAP